VITRRLFVGAMAAACVPGNRLVLEAIAAEKMPQRLIVHGVARAEFFELRDYGESPLAGFFEHSAILHDGGRFLFAFDSLAQRESTWRSLSADPQWIALSRNVTLRELTIFRPASYNANSYR
jgi:hypothetical protein